MRFGERVQNLPDRDDRFAQAHQLHAVDARGEQVAFEQFHREIEKAAFGLAEVEHAHRVRMRQ